MPGAGPRGGPPPSMAPRYEGGPGPGYAPSGPPFHSQWQQQNARNQMLAGRRVPLPLVIQRLKRSTGADYVDTHEVLDPQGRPVYILRFRQHGHYIDVPVDAETGDVQR